MIGAGTGEGSNLGAVGDSGELYVLDTDSYTLGLSVVAFTVVDDITAGIKSGVVSLDGPAGTMTINKVGKYQAIMTMSFSLNGGAKIDGAFFVNDVESTRGRFERDIANVNDVGSVAASALFEVTAGQLPFVLDFRLKSDTASRTIAIEHMSAAVTGAGV